MLVMYLIKLLAILLLGPLYFIIAIAIFAVDKDRALLVFEKYLILIFRIFEVQVNFEFDEPEIRHGSNSILVVLNQSSFLDSLVCPLIPMKPFKGIINFEFALYPVIGWFITLFSFTIARQWPSQAKRTLNHADAFLRNGGNVLISIEGKRSRDGKINEYKKGPIVMAINNQSNIIPIIIYGSKECLPVGSLRIKPGVLKLRFLKPIATHGLTYEDRNELLLQLKNTAKKEGLIFRNAD